MASLPADSLSKLKDEIIKLRPKFVDFQLIHKTKFVNWKAQDFWRDCANFKDTLIVCKSQFGVIMGLYCPDTWKNYGKGHKVQNGNVFVLFTEQN